ncbi:MAG: exosortase/archaeosortase family protein [Desulfomonilia bacterium]|jgi:exosortase
MSNSSERETFENSKKHLLLWGLLTLSFIACYYTTFMWLNYKYQGQDSYYSHGYLIPFVTAYLIYLKRNEIREAPVGSSSWGLGVIVLALVIRIFGALGDINFASGFSIVLYCFGCSLFLLGSQITKILAFPLLFLVFMCPIPEAYINIIALPSKSIATSLALFIMDIFRVPYIREGFIVHLAQATFVVGTPCNGMRSLISFAALGVLMLYLFRASLWKKIIFLAMIPPLAVLLNGARIALLLWIAYAYGEKAASPESYLHDGSGLLVFIIGFVTMMFLVRKINEQKNS